MYVCICVAFEVFFFAVPVQYSGSDGACEKPWSFVPADTLPAMWHIVYWTSQVLTW